MNDPARTHKIFENLLGMRHRVLELSGFSTFARVGRGRRGRVGSFETRKREVSERADGHRDGRKRRNARAAAAVREIHVVAGPRAGVGPAAAFPSYLYVVSPPQLHDAAHRLARRELGARLVHQVAHVLASPRHARGKRARQWRRRLFPGDETRKGAGESFELEIFCPLRRGQSLARASATPAPAPRWRTRCSSP
jgi:hypothetical protein